MAKTTREKNQMECNKRARAKYNAENYKYQSVKLKISELNYIDEYCAIHNIPKNTLMRRAIMEYIGKSIDC